MTECSYCGESFADEDALLDHLGAVHDDELGRIDRRRVEDRSGGGSGRGDLLRYGAVAVSIAVVVLGLIAGVIILGGSGGGPAPAAQAADADIQPTDYGSVHAHGLMDAEIDGETLDFAGDQQLISQGNYFHFHGGSNVWHAHADRISLEYALATLGIQVSEGGSVLEYDGTVYDDADANTTVEVTIDGEAVDPASYLLEGVSGDQPSTAAPGDHIRVNVTTD